MQNELSGKRILSRYKTYLESINATEINVSDTENSMLYPLFSHIKYSFDIKYQGVIIADRQGIYTPIEFNGDEVTHLIKVPRIGIAVYGITDMRSIVHTRTSNLIIIFQGVYETIRSGYDFIDNSFYIRPIPGVAFEKKNIVLHLVGIDGTTIEDEEVEDEDDYV